MPKDAYYFPHDYNAHNDPALIKLAMDGWDLVGLYWAIIEKLHEQNGWMEMHCESIAFALRADKERIARVLQSELFVIKDDKFTSNRVLENMAKREEKRRKTQESALKGWTMRSHSKRNAIKERKGKEIKTKTHKHKQFIKPTVEQLEEYCKESNLSIDCNKWINHYESNGWRVGKNPMVNWKAAAQNWVKNEFGGNGKHEENSDVPIQFRTKR